MRHASHVPPNASSSLVLRWAVRLGASALMCVTLAGCQSLTSRDTTARVRVIDVSPDSPALDIYQGGNALAYNLSLGTVTSYVPVAPGASSLTVSPAGSRRALATVEGDFRTSTRYTMLIGRPLARMQPLLLTDQLPAATAKEQPAPMLRIVHQAERTGPLDVYLVPAGRRVTTVAPMVTNLVPDAATGYLPVPVCTCSVVLLPAGTAPSTGTASHIGAQLAYASGTARTLILLDPPPDSSILQVITTEDGESPAEP